MGRPCSIRSPFLKSFAGALSLLYFVGNVALAHSAESNFWSDRRRSAAQGGTGPLLACVPSVRLPAAPGGAILPSQIDPQFPENIRRRLPPEFLKAQNDLLRSLPYAEGSVRKISVPSPFSPNGPVVIHIQDIHRNFEAQRRIAAAVAALAKQADVVGLEGSMRAIDLARFRAFPDHNAVAIAAEESLAQNEITGPIQAALTGTDPFPAVIGIDDPVHYRANIGAYRRSAPRMAEEKQKLAALITENEMAKQKTCNPALQRFDRQVKDYREGRTSLSAYLKALTEGHPRLSPEVRRFREALSMEEQMDFQAVESERANAVGILAARLDAGGVAQLTERGTEYRAGALRYGEFYRFLKDLCAHHGIPFGKHLDAYVRYVLLSDSVDAGALFDELHAIETVKFKSLAKSNNERALLAQSRQYYLAGKLIDFSLTPEEWKEYLAQPTPGLESFESFYREAHTRDGAMAANLLAALGRANPKNDHPVAVLVTGGYHAPGLADQLTRAGAAVISFVPKIEKVDTADGPIALGIFTQEKTPLQKLFEGEKLFLGQDPMPLEAEQLGVPAKITALASLEPADSLNRLVPKPLMKLILFIKRVPTFFSIRIKTYTLNVSVDLDAPVGKRLVSSVVAIGAGTVLWATLATGSSDILIHLYNVSKESFLLPSGGFPLFVGMISFGRFFKEWFDKVILAVFASIIKSRALISRPLFISPSLKETIDRSSQIAANAIREVGDYLVAVQDEAAEKVEEKADGSLVSFADKEAQRKLEEAIRKVFPDHTILGEEGPSNSVSSGKGFTWHIDPLDGSKSYLKRNNGNTKNWGILIGLEYNGQPVLGICYFPLLNGDDGHPLLVVARVDGPPGIEVNGIFKKPLKQNELPNSLGEIAALVFPTEDNDHPENTPLAFKFMKIIPTTYSVGLRIVSIALKRVGSKIDGETISLGYASYPYKVNKWDIYAPGFILEKAGGALHEYGHWFRPFFTKKGQEGGRGYVAAISHEIAALCEWLKWKNSIKNMGIVIPNTSSAHLSFDLEKVDAVDKNKLTGDYFAVNMLAGYPFSGSLQDRLGKWTNEIKNIIGRPFHEYLNFSHISLGCLRNNGRVPLTATDLGNLSSNAGLINAMKTVGPGTAIMDKILVNEEGFIVLMGRLQGPLVKTREVLKSLGFGLVAPDRVHTTIGHISKEVVQTLDSDTINQLAQWIDEQNEILIKSPLEIPINQIRLVATQSYDGSRLIGNKELDLTNGIRNFDDHLKSLVSRNLKPFNSMDRLISSLAWGLVSAIGLLFELNLLNQGDLFMGGLMGVLLIYPTLISLHNLLDPIFASLSSFWLISGGPRAPPAVDVAAVKISQQNLGLSQYQIASTLEELNSAEGRMDRLIVVPPALLSQLARDRNHRFAFATHGLTDFETRTVYLSDIYFRPFDNRFLSWVQTHARSIVIARERQRLSPSPFLRSAFAIDLLRPFQPIQKTNYLNASPSGYYSGFYLWAIFVGAIGLTFLTASFIDWETSSKWIASVLVFFMFLLNHGKADGLASKLFNPATTLLPELNFGNELPAEHKAIVYYPILFRNESDLAFFDAHLLPSIEQNPDKHLTWVVMSTSGSPLREKELEKIRQLQNQFGEDRILYFHRAPEIKNWEFKRGGYMHFLHWLRQNQNAGGLILSDPRFPATPAGKVFDQIVGSVGGLNETAYFLISDSDFIWPAGTVRRMVAKMAHPANSRFGIFQAHSEHHNTNASLFTMLGGMTPTSLLQRTRNWGMLGQVNFSGSGAGIRIDRFTEDIAGKMRDGFLSHDLVESFFSRTAFVQDVTTLGETPVNLMLRLRQWERWWRGNKIAFHLFRPRIQNESLEKVPNPGTPVNKYLLYQSSRFYLGTFLSFTLVILLFFIPVHFTSAGWAQWTILALFFYETLFFELYHARGARERLGLIFKTLASFFLNPPVVFEVFRIIVRSYWEDVVVKISGKEKKRFAWVPQGSLTTDRTLGTCFRIFWMATTVGTTISALAIFGPVSPFVLLFFGPLALTPFLAWITAFPLDIFSYKPIGPWLRGRVLSVKNLVIVAALLTALTGSSHTHGEEELIFDSSPWRVLGTQDSGPGAKLIRTPKGNYSELKILHDRDQIGSVKGNGYYRVTPPGTVWGSSFVTPGYWVNGRYYHNCEITDLSFSLDATKRLKLLGRINATHLASDDFTILFLQGDAKKVEIQVSFTIKAKSAVSFDSERNTHGESFKPFQFSSMNVGFDWDADKAVAVSKGHREESRLDRANSFVFQKPVPVAEDTEISLTNDRSDRPRNTPTTYVRLAGKNPGLFAGGWVAPSKDSNDDNVGVWLGRGPQTVGMWVGYVARDSYKNGETIGQFNFIAGSLPPATSLTAKPVPTKMVANVDSYERARQNIDSMKTFIRAYIESQGYSVMNEGWLSGIAQFYSLPLNGKRPFSDLTNELNWNNLKELAARGIIRKQSPGASLSTPWKNSALLFSGVLSISTAWAGEIGGSVAWWVFVTNGLIPVIVLMMVLFSWRVLSSGFVQATSVLFVKDTAEKEAQNTASVSGLMKAWPYQGSLQIRQSNGIRWLRSMSGSLRSPAFRETYKNALTDQRIKYSPFDGSTDLFNRFLRSLTGGVPGSARATVSLDIVSGNDLGGVARMLDHLDFLNQGSKTPIQIVFAGETPEDVQKLQELKLNGPRGYVHVVDVPVAPKGVLDPYVLAQGIERLADFPTNVPVSWVLAVSPNISINPSTLGSLGDRGLAGSLKEALARYIAQLIDGRLKPADMNTLVEIVALVWRSA